MCFVGFRWIESLDAGVVIWVFPYWCMDLTILVVGAINRDERQKVMWEGGEMGGMTLANLFRVSMFDGIRTA